MLINGFSFLQMVERNRVVYLSGRTGAGKTALAFKIADHLLSSGFSRYLLTNCASVWADDMDDIKPDGDYLDTVVILDEAGQFIKFGRDAEVFLSYLRKMNVVILVPSASKPSAKMRFLTVQRTFDFTVIGLPLWLYNVDLGLDRIREKGWFGWFGPSEIYGIYDTMDTPIDDCGIGDFLVAHQEEVVRRRGHGKHRKYGGAVAIRNLEESGGATSVFGGQSDPEYLADVMASASDEISHAVSVLEHVAEGDKRRWRKNHKR